MQKPTSQNALYSTIVTSVRVKEPLKTLYFDGGRIFLQPRWAPAASG